jgi:bacillithiol system protein YtxJ
MFVHKTNNTFVQKLILLLFFQNIMNWISLNDAHSLENIKKDSFLHPILIFKHSTRCSISSTALSRFERHWNDAKAGTLQPYMLDLLSHRAISSMIADVFGVEHQSPQVLVIVEGQCVHHASHYDISFDDTTPPYGS